VGYSFSQYTKRLPLLLKALVSSPGYTIQNGLPDDIPKAGIYLFSSGNKNLYIGRSDNIRRRMRLHTRPSAGHNQATLAFRITKHVLDIPGPSYRPKGSRIDLLLNKRFHKTFMAAKDDLRMMQVRFVAVDEPIMQALFEIYAALELKTPYNEFKTT
jgi:hypothetical protein